MPFILTNTDFSPLVIDNEFEIVDDDLLATYVGELLLGNHLHIMNVINKLNSTSPASPDHSVDYIVKVLENSADEKRDGWLFQMISWLVLVKKHAGDNLYTQQPHGAPAHHGLDGLGILLKSDNTIEKIIVCEDKFTNNPRNLIQRQVWPEFESFERSEKDHVLVGTISAILRNLDAGKIFQQVQNDIFNRDLRLYRVGINRLETHNSEDGRKKLFADYNQCVSGSLPRRGGATTFIKKHREWMGKFAAIVIAYLKTKKKS